MTAEQFLVQWTSDDVKDKLYLTMKSICMEDFVQTGGEEFRMLLQSDPSDLPKHSHNNSHSRYGFNPGHVKNKPSLIEKKFVEIQFTRHKFCIYVFMFFFCLFFLCGFVCPCVCVCLFFVCFHENACHGLFLILC